MYDRGEVRAGVGTDDRVEAAVFDRGIGEDRAKLCVEIIGDLGIVGVDDVDGGAVIGTAVLDIQIDERVRSHLHAALFRKIVQLALGIDLEQRADVKRCSDDSGSGADTSAAL